MFHDMCKKKIRAHLFKKFLCSTKSKLADDIGDLYQDSINGEFRTSANVHTRFISIKKLS